MKKRALVIGASGDVGSGIFRALTQRGWDVVAAGRSIDRIRQKHGSEVSAVAVDLTTVDLAATTGDAVSLDALDLIVVSVSARSHPMRVADLTPDDLLSQFRDNLIPHLNAVREIVPRMREGAVYLAIGGGMADFAVAGLSAESMVQAAERVLIRTAAKEFRAEGVTIRLASIAAPVAGHGAEMLGGIDAVPADTIGALIMNEIDSPEDDRVVVTIVDPRQPREQGKP